MNTKQIAVAVIGCLGHNVTARILPELHKLSPASITGYDLVGAPTREIGFPCVRVRDNAELGYRLKRQAPNSVLIETCEQSHAKLIRLALESGARLVVCDKPCAATLAEVEELLCICRATRPSQRAFVLDHYANLLSVRLVRQNARRWLGSVRAIEVTLLERLGVPANQVASHARGLGQFAHHLLGIAGCFVDLSRLEPVAAVRANHSASPIPDSYRGAAFTMTDGQPISIRGCVGKYIEKPTRRITIEGTAGTVVIDRSREELQLTCTDGFTMNMQLGKDTGYCGLAWSLASSKPLPSFMTIEKASKALALVEAANAIALELKEYPDGSEPLLPLTEAINARQRSAA